jgi:hypothetical protein
MKLTLKWLRKWNRMAKSGSECSQINLTFRRRCHAAIHAVSHNIFSLVMDGMERK